jgi:hypothetical protein
METLFGIPVQFLMWLFGGALVVILALSVYATIRQPVLFRLSVRNIPRRIGRAALIVIGLMLATTIISAAFGTGDTIAKTIRTEVITSLGNIDEIVSAQEEGDIEVTGETAQPSMRPSSRPCARFSPRTRTWTGSCRCSGRAPASRT